MNAEQAKSKMIAANAGNRLFANNDDSINVLNIPGITNNNNNTLD